MPPRDRCRFCNLLEDSKNLIDACDCYKKSDTGRSHKECLEAYISKWEHEYRTNPERASNRAGLHCPACKTWFRVRLRFRASTNFFWSRASIHAYFEGLLIFVMTLMARGSPSLTPTAPTAAKNW